VRDADLGKKVDIGRLVFFIIVLLQCFERQFVPINCFIFILQKYLSLYFRKFG
jgi:hypothetical protein